MSYSDRKEFGFYAYENNQITGGVWGKTDMGNWVYVELLYVGENHRGKDVGMRLMREVERYARDGKYVGIHLSTWDWQAKEFYQKMGFVEFGKLNNHPFGNSKHYMKKELELL